MLKFFVYESLFRLAILSCIWFSLPYLPFYVWVWGHSWRKMLKSMILCYIYIYIEREREREILFLSDPSRIILTLHGLTNWASQPIHIWGIPKFMLAYKSIVLNSFWASTNTLNHVLCFIYTSCRYIYQKVLIIFIILGTNLVTFRK